MADSRQLKVVITGDASQVRRAFSDVDRGLDRTGRGAGQVGASVRRGLDVASVAVIGLGVVASKSALEFERTFTQMQGLAGVTADEVEGLRGQVLSLSGDTAQAPQQLAEGLYFIRSSGLEGKAALDALEVSAKGAAIGLGTTAVVADTVTSAVNAYGAENLSAAEAGDVLAASVKEGKREADEIGPTLGRLLPVAENLGIEFDEVGGSLAYLTRGGSDAAESSTQLSAIMRTLVKPSQQAQDALEEIGLSSSELRRVVREDGLLAALQLLDERLGGNTEAMGKVFNNSRALTGVLALLKGGGEEAAGVLASVADSTGAVDDAFAILQETDAFQAEQALANLQSAGIELGASLAPTLADVAGAIGGVASGFADLPGPAQKVILGIGGIVAVAGPAVRTVDGLSRVFDATRAQAGRLPGGIDSSTRALRGLGKAAGAAGIAFVGFEAARFVLEEIGSRTSVLAGETDGLADSLVNLRDQQVVVGTLDRVYGDDLQGLADQIKDVSAANDDFAASGDSMGKVGEAMSTVGQAISGVHGQREDINEVGEALQTILDTDGPELARQTYDALRARLEELGVTTGDLDSVFGGFENNLTDAELSAEAMGGAAEGTGEAQSGLADETTAAAEAAQEQADAAKEAEENLDSLVNTILSAFDAETAYERAMRESREQVDAYMLSQIAAANGGEEAQGNLQESYDSTLDALRDQADAYVDLAVSQAEAEGATLTAEQQNALYREELMRLAGTLAPGDPLRERIAGLIADLGTVADAKAQGLGDPISIDVDDSLVRDAGLSALVLVDQLKDVEAPREIVLNGERWWPTARMVDHWTRQYDDSTPEAEALLKTGGAQLGFASLSQWAAFYSSLDPATTAQLNEDPASVDFAALALRAEEWRRQHPTATADVDTGPVWSKMSEIERARWKAQVDVYYNDLGFVPRGIGPEGDRALPRRWGGIHETARWGRIPAHVTEDPTILYGERETGGEAMIPRLGNKAKSMSILGQAANWYGAQVVPKGMGGKGAGAAPMGPVHVTVVNDRPIVVQFDSGVMREIGRDRTVRRELGKYATLDRRAGA